jgi:diadenosine tetraphosphate (Ap4A) HIT family hydrolase
MSSTCKFCEKFGGVTPERKSEIWDQVLFQSRNFVVVPTVGSIVPGWVLIVPRQHFLCIGSMGDALLHELNELRHEVILSLKSRFGPVAIFEHGPAKMSTLVGCGVDHAHLHLVATQIDLLAGAQAITEQPLSWAKVSGLDETTTYYKKQKSYLYVESPGGESWIGTGPHIQSQLFRQVIATASGQKEAFDWKRDIFETNVSQTIHEIGEWKASLNSNCDKLNV